ncbi:hypothetical protein [Congregibacter sp.]|jgi:hypothetical protein
MSTDRRKNNRESPDRRRDTRSNVPVWAYVFAIAGVTVVLTAFWALVYS